MKYEKRENIPKRTYQNLYDVITNQWLLFVQKQFHKHIEAKNGKKNKKIMRKI